MRSNLVFTSIVWASGGSTSLARLKSELLLDRDSSILVILACRIVLCLQVSSRLLWSRCTCSSSSSLIIPLLCFWCDNVEARSTGNCWIMYSKWEASSSAVAFCSLAVLSWAFRSMVKFWRSRTRWLCHWFSLWRSSTSYSNWFTCFCFLWNSWLEWEWCSW